MRNVRTVFVFGLAYLVIFSSNIRAVEITVSDTTINIPSPSQFAEISSLSPETFQMFKDMSPASNRLLAVFVSEADSGRLLRGESAILNQYMMVQSNKTFEGLSLAKHQFKEIREVMRKQYDSVFQEKRDLIDQMTKKAGDALSKSFNAEIGLEIGEVVPLGVDSDTTSSITISQLTKLKAIVSGQSSESVVAGTMTTMLVGGKVLYLYVFRTYHNDADLTWARKTAQDWVSQTLAANETVWPLATGSIVPSGTVVDPVTKELLAGEMSAYNLKSHPKAQGLNITVEYPKSWRAEEGVRPHIVQKFTGDEVGGVSPSCMVLVLKAQEEDLFLEEDDSEEEVKEALRNMLPENAVYIDGGKTKIDGEPCGWMKYYLEAERAGIQAGMCTLQYILFCGDKILVIQCSVFALANEKELVEDAFLSYLPVFQMIGNSIVIHDKWTRPDKRAVSNDSVMEELFGEYWLLNLILSAILTWGIGLAPPLLIRFILVRRPLSRGVSIAIVVLFCVFNITLFTALGSKNKTHAALFLVAWASYAILRKATRKEHARKLQDISKSSQLPSEVEGVNDLVQSDRVSEELSKPMWEESIDAGPSPQNDDAAVDQEDERSPSTSAGDVEEAETLTDETLRTPVAEPPQQGPTGVGGWLVFFCVALTILGPLFSLGRMTIYWEEAEPAFARYPSLRTAVYFESVGLAFILLYGFVVGCMIWGGNPSGKRLAKQYLLIRLFGFIVIEVITLLLMSSLPPQAVSAMLGGIVGAVFREGFYFLVWWLYFKKSKRVRNTYGLGAN